MLTGEMPDIFNTSTSWMTYSEDVTSHLVDLSTYGLTDNILPTQLRDVEIEGKVYLLHCNYDLLGITYNKILFEEHGWTVPTSFEELKALAPRSKRWGSIFLSPTIPHSGIAECSPRGRQYPEHGGRERYDPPCGCE